MKTYFTKAKTSSSTLTLALPAMSNMQRIITWLTATNDKAATTASVWLSSISRTSSASAASGQKVMGCALTAGIVLNDIVIIQDAVDPTKFEINTMGAVAANVSYTLANNLANTYAAGSKVYGLKTGGGTSAAAYVYAVGAAQVDKSNATALIVADKDQAILLEHSSATAICDFFVSGFNRG